MSAGSGGLRLNHLDVFGDGRLVVNGRFYRCAVGKGGIASNKLEGDGATPAGKFVLRQLHVRRDRIGKPHTTLATRALYPVDRWCDDPFHASYNRLVSAPFRCRHEKMWRTDGLYDLVIELGYNDSPPKRGLGSAIFFHVAAPDYAPTEGCVALNKKDFLAVLPKLHRHCRMIVHS